MIDKVTHLQQAIFISQSTYIYIPVLLIWITQQDKMTPLFVNLSHAIGPKNEYSEGET